MNNLPIWPLCRGKIATRWLNIYPPPPRGSTGFFFCFVFRGSHEQRRESAHRNQTPAPRPVEFKRAPGSSRTEPTQREKAGEGLKAVCFCVMRSQEHSLHSSAGIKER